MPNLPNNREAIERKPSPFEEKKRRNEMHPLKCQSIQANDNYQRL